MLLDEDPATLIYQCLNNFNIAPDRAALTRINTSLSTLTAARDLRLSSSRTSLHKLERSLASLNQQHELSLSSYNAAEHANNVLKLDAQKFKVAKEASEAEVEKERLEAEIVILEGQLRELEQSNANGGARQGSAQERRMQREAQRSADQAVLKLKLYRSLGIDLDADSASRCTKAVIRDTTKGDAHVVEFNQNGAYRNQRTDELWQAL